MIHRGVAAVRRALPRILKDAGNGLSDLSRGCFAELYSELCALDEKVARDERKIARIHQAHEVCRRLDEIIGIGPLTATAAYAAVRGCAGISQRPPLLGRARPGA